MPSAQEKVHEKEDTLEVYLSIEEEEVVAEEVATTLPYKAGVVTPKEKYCQKM